VPLIVPEINPETAKNAKLIANPNCTTAILVVALFPIYKKFGLKKVIISTYQATSGGGAAAMNELETETRNYLNGEKIKNEKFAHPIPFNLIPAIDKFLPENDFYTKEEMKVAWETRKIFGDESLKISTTAVRIPTFRAHAESVSIETVKKVSPQKVREILQNAAGVEVRDDPENQVYPMPISATKKFDVEVGRIRRNSVFGEFGIDFFVCGDQILKGAALNAVQIAELFVF
jgi:aspartate-semialdehyde dehydrogenase